MESMEERRKRFYAGNESQNLCHQLPERRLARQISAVGGEIDPRKHDLGEALIGQAPCLLDNGSHRHAARVSAAIGDDAERAAMVAAVLYLQERACAAVEAVHELRRGLAHGHDVVDAHALAKIEIGMGIELLSIAEDRIDFIHAGIGQRLGLYRAACDDDLLRWILAAGPSDGLARLAHGLCRHRAGVEDDRVVEAGFARARLHGPRIS